MPTMSVPSIKAFAHPRLEVARPVQFVVKPDCWRKLPDIRVSSGAGSAPACNRAEGRFGCQHAGLDRGMAALDARSVQKAGVVADQHAAGKCDFGQALQPAGGERAGAVGDAPAALEKSGGSRDGSCSVEIPGRRLRYGLL